MATLCRLDNRISETGHTPWQVAQTSTVLSQPKISIQQTDNELYWYITTSEEWAQYPRISIRSFQWVAWFSTQYRPNNNTPATATPADVYINGDIVTVICISDQHRQEQPTHMTKTTTTTMLQQHIEALPPALQHICGQITYPADGGLTLADHIKTQNPILSISDGSIRGTTHA